MSTLGTSMLTRIMNSPIGQTLLSLTEKAVTTVEKCLEWSLPTTDPSAEVNGKPFSTIELERPLPWVLFLPTLLVLRVVRFIINAGAQLIGKPTYEAADMVRIVRSARKRLTAIRSENIRSRRSRSLSCRQDSTSLKEASKSLVKSLRLTLSTLSCLDSSSFKTSPSPPPTKIRVSKMLDAIGAVEDQSDSEANQVAGGEAGASNKRKQLDMSSDEDISSDEDDERIIEMVNRLANDPSSEDSDFEPGLSDLESNDSQDSEDDEDQCYSEIPSEEVEDLKNMTAEMLKNERENISKTAEKNALKPANKQSPSRSDALKQPTNGTGEEPEINYCSPTSWKSFSPDVSNPFDKESDHIYIQEKSKEVSNGEVSDGKKKIGNDSSTPVVAPITGDVSNGNLKEKSHPTSSGKHQQHHQKNKRGSHGNRKKK